jgi:hypothetical protein
MAVDFPSTGLVANVTTFTSGTNQWLWTGSAWKSIYSTAGLAGPIGPTGPAGPTGPSGTSAVTLGALATTYTLALTDVDKLYTTNAAGSTVTVPLNATVAFPIGSQISFVATTAVPNLTIVATGGVTINAQGLRLRAANSSATLIKTATDTWYLLGDLVV